MTPADLAALHPKLYHVTLAGAWAGIRARGLLSPARLTAHLPEAEQNALLTRRRAERVQVQHPVHGPVHLNDNRPLLMGSLALCLEDGLTPQEWLVMLNARVFFFPTRAKAKGFADAAANRGQQLLVLHLDTLGLARAHLPRMEISPINSGGAVRKPPRRGFRTFAPIDGLDYRAWRRWRGLVGADSIAEIVIRDGVPDIADFFVECERVPA